jgi:hypothetical protein
VSTVAQGARDWQRQWRRLARAYIAHFAASGKPFTGPEVRAYAYADGMDRPPHDRCWGPVFVKARYDGLIRQVGQVLSDMSMRRQLIRQWVGA